MPNLSKIYFPDELYSELVKEKKPSTVLQELYRGYVGMKKKK